MFNTWFNLSFKAPKFDTCDTCDSFSLQLQGSLNQIETNYIKAEYGTWFAEPKWRYYLKNIDIKLVKKKK